MVIAFYSDKLNFIALFLHLVKKHSFYLKISKFGFAYEITGLPASYRRLRLITLY